MSLFKAFRSSPSKILWLAEKAASVARQSPNPRYRYIALALDKKVLPIARRSLQRRLEEEQREIREKAQ